MVAERSALKPVEREHNVEVRFGGRDLIYFENHSTGDIVKAAIAQHHFDIDDQVGELSKMPGSNVIEKIEDGFGRTLLIGGDCETYPEKPYKTGSDSEAYYLAKYQVSGFVFLVQSLGPYSRTSNHLHPYSRETFISRSQELYIWSDNKIVLPVKCILSTKIKEPHLAFTLNNSAFSFITQVGGNFEHDPQEIPDIEFLIQKAIEQGFYRESESQRSLLRHTLGEKTIWENGRWATKSAPVDL